jgi:hypothetical protein
MGSFAYSSEPLVIVFLLFFAGVFHVDAIGSRLAHHLASFLIELLLFFFAA